MRCRELRTLFGFKLPADLAQAFIAARGSAGAQDAFHEVRAADAGSTGSLSSLRVSASACWYLSADGREDRVSAYTQDGITLTVNQAASQAVTLGGGAVNQQVTQFDGTACEILPSR
jgi:hypothetical protein